MLSFSALYGFRGLNAPWYICWLRCVY